MELASSVRPLATHRNDRVGEYQDAYNSPGPFVGQYPDVRHTKLAPGRPRPSARCPSARPCMQVSPLISTHTIDLFLTIAPKGGGRRARNISSPGPRKVGEHNLVLDVPARLKRAGYARDRPRPREDGGHSCGQSKPAEGARPGQVPVLLGSHIIGGWLPTSEGPLRSCILLVSAREGSKLRHGGENLVDNTVWPHRAVTSGCAHFDAGQAAAPQAARRSQ